MHFVLFIGIVHFCYLIILMYFLLLFYHCSVLLLFYFICCTAPCNICFERRFINKITLPYLT